MPGIKIGTWLAAIAVVALYGAYPYFTLYRIQAAIEARDPVALDTYVDWPAVRAGVKSDLRAQMAKGSLQSQSLSDQSPDAQLGAGFSAKPVPMMIDKAVDAMVSSESLFNAVAQDGSKSAAKAKLWDYVSYAFFSSPTDFRVDVRDPKEADGPKASVLMSLTGATWRVTRVHLPLSEKNLPAWLSPDSAKSPPHEVKPPPQEVKSPPQEAPARAPKPSTSSFGNKMTMSEIDAVRRQIERCWNVPVGVKDAKDLVVDIHVVMNRDGTVREAIVVDQARMQSDGVFRAAAESARRAIYFCQPLSLPPAKYSLWQDMTLSFNPSEIL
jgi:Protein of unknown function (DUF2939)